MPNEIQKLQNTEAIVTVESSAMSLETVKAQVQQIQQIMAAVMKRDEHYGVIPGCGGKPSLLKPGAEKLGLTFRLAPAYAITVREMPREHREYEVVCTLTHIPTGTVVGQGVGSCSTMEGKFRFRKAEQLCPKCGKPTIIKGKQEYGGGWLCYAKKGGCGAKFQDGDKAIENQNMGRIEHDNPADYYNTALKMGKKRAQVDAILTATAASDIFTQDLEDMPEVIPEAKASKIEDAVTPEERATFDRPKPPVDKVKTAFKGTEQPAVDPEKMRQNELWDLLTFLYDNDVEKATRALVEYSSFPGKDGKLVPGIDDISKLTGKRLLVTLAKVKEANDMK